MVGIAQAMLREEAIVRNFVPISHYFVRNLCLQCQHPPIMVEAGLLDRLRNFVSNPQLAQRQLATSAGSSQNTRAAKLAVQLLADQLRTTFEMKLDELGMSPSEMAKKWKTWQQLKALEAKTGGNPSPDLVNAMVQTSSELQKVYEFFHESGMLEELKYEAPEATDVTEFIDENPVETEVVDEKPEDKAQRLATDIANDDTKWLNLMRNAQIRAAVEAELTPQLPPDSQHTVETIPPQARLILLRRLIKNNQEEANRTNSSNIHDASSTLFPLEIK
jgi:hypothetical protein